jgi:hypothetical protein
MLKYLRTILDRNIGARGGYWQFRGSDISRAASRSPKLIFTEGFRVHPQAMRGAAKRFVLRVSEYVEVLDSSAFMKTTLETLTKAIETLGICKSPRSVSLQLFCHVSFSIPSALRKQFP